MNFGSLFGLDHLGKVISNAVGSVFADIWCVAIFVLIDVAQPYVSNMLGASGLLTGVGGTFYENLIQVLKLQIFQEWKGAFKFIN